MEIPEIIATYAIGLAILEGLRMGRVKGGPSPFPLYRSVVLKSLE